MILRPSRSTRTDSPCPYTTLCRSHRRTLRRSADAAIAAQEGHRARCLKMLSQAVVDLARYHRERALVGALVIERFDAGRADNLARDRQGCAEDRRLLAVQSLQPVRA